jgi:hypothetical protein
MISWWNEVSLLSSLIKRSELSYVHKRSSNALNRTGSEDRCFPCAENADASRLSCGGPRSHCFLARAAYLGS